MWFIMEHEADPLNADGVKIYSNIKFVLQIAQEDSQKFWCDSSLCIGSECMPLSQNQAEFCSNILLLFIQNILCF